MTHRTNLDPNPRTEALAIAIACSALCAPALASEVNYDCTVLPATSSLTQTTDLVSPFAGTLIGDYDATTNPTGTRTLPGLFGGSGNNPISYTASFVLGGDIVSHPTGSLTVGVDLATSTVRVSGLALDFLGGAPGTLGATLNINYQSFHTVQPTAIYPGGITIPIPLGSGSVTTLRADQTGGAVPGVLVPQKGGTYTFAVVVPVDLSVVATLLDQPVSDGTPTPGVLPLNGTLSIGAGDTVALSVSIVNDSSVTQPVTTGGFTDLPLAIPTVIPAGSTANVLMSGTVTEVTVGTALDALLSISGTRASVPGDLNGDGIVNSFDLAILLDNWGGSGLGDLNSDGIVNSFDLAILLDNWQ
jgi:hypothetical protein